MKKSWQIILLLRLVGFGLHARFYAFIIERNGMDDFLTAHDTLEAKEYKEFSIKKICNKWMASRGSILNF